MRHLGLVSSLNQYIIVQTKAHQSQGQQIPVGIGQTCGIWSPLKNRNSTVLSRAMRWQRQLSSEFRGKTTTAMSLLVPCAGGPASVLALWVVPTDPPEKSHTRPQVIHFPLFNSQQFGFSSLPLQQHCKCTLHKVSSSLICIVTSLVA